MTTSCSNNLSCALERPAAVSRSTALLNRPPPPHLAISSHLAVIHDFTQFQRCKDRRRRLEWASSRTEPCSAFDLAVLVQAIYNDCILTVPASVSLVIEPVELRVKKLQSAADEGLPTVAVEKDGICLGWAGLAPFYREEGYEL